MRTLNLRTRISAAGLLFFIGVIWLFVHYLDRQVRDDFREVLVAQQYQTLDRLARNLDKAIDLRINALSDIAVLLQPQWMESPEDLQAFLATRVPMHRFFNGGLLVISAAGIVLADDPDVGMHEGKSHAETVFFREVLATGKPAVGKPLAGRVPQESVIYIAVPIRNASREIVGVLAGANRLTSSDWFGESMLARKNMDGDFHVLSPKDRLFVMSTDPGRILQPDPAVGINRMYDRYRTGYEGSGITVSSRGVEEISSGRRLASTGWIAVAALPTAIAFRPLDTLRGEIYRSAGAASLLAALLLWGFLYRQLTPLSRSAQRIDAMADGREPLRALHLEGGREIRQLLDSFNKLQQRIHEQAQSLEKSTEELRLAASVFEGSSEAILISDADRRILSVNTAFCAMSGYDRDELIGANTSLLSEKLQERAFVEEIDSALRLSSRWEGEIMACRKSGEIFPQRLAMSALRDADGNATRYIAIVADITRQKEAEQVIWRQANYDLLTNLPNRYRFQELVQQAVQQTRHRGRSFALLYVDLDRFLDVNDTLGHDIGDQLIIETGKRICACIGGPDVGVVAHLGGDEFAVLAATADSSLRAEQMADTVLWAIAEPFQVGGETMHVTASIGIACYPDDAMDAVSLLKKADQAKRVAKSEGRNRFCCFTAAMERAAQRKMQLANDMRGALAGNQLEVHYQPIVELATGRTVKAEALLRWHHPERGVIRPEEFIPIAEETGLISEIGDWVFRQAAQTARRWCRKCEFWCSGHCTKPRPVNGAPYWCHQQITINKSPRQFFSGNTARTWVDYLRKHDIQTGCIAIEITEGLLLDPHPEILQKLMDFREAGVHVALDDFGTGYSAMSYLKRFSISYLKLDRSFIRDIVSDRSDQAIAEAIILMAHKLGLKVVAEGIETSEQRALLMAAGCDFGQGYLFAGPMPGARFEAFVARPGGSLEGPPMGDEHGTPGATAPPGQVS